MNRHRSQLSPGPVSAAAVALVASLCGSSPASASAPACVSSALAIEVDGADGRFAGMSHDGAIVTVRNVGPSACTLDRHPRFAMLDRTRAVVAVDEPSPASAPDRGPRTLVAPGAVAASIVRWIDGDVYGGSPAREVTSQRLRLAVSPRAIAAPLQATVWSERDAPVTFEATDFTTALPDLGPPLAPAAGTYVGEGPDGSTYTERGVAARKLVLGRANGGSMRFAYAASGGARGDLSGTLHLRSTTAVYLDEPNRCRLAIAFYGTQLVVDQTGVCGLGNLGGAGGRYVRVR